MQVTHNYTELHPSWCWCWSEEPSITSESGEKGYSERPVCFHRAWVQDVCLSVVLKGTWVKGVEAWPYSGAQFVSSERLISATPPCTQFNRVQDTSVQITPWCTQITGIYTLTQVIFFEFYIWGQISTHSLQTCRALGVKVTGRKLPPENDCSSSAWGRILTWTPLSYNLHNINSAILKAHSCVEYM